MIITIFYSGISHMKSGNLEPHTTGLPTRPTVEFAVCYNTQNGPCTFHDKQLMNVKLLWPKPVFEMGD